jgi:hypothetical protein
MKRTLLILISILSIHAYAQIPTVGMLAGYSFNGNANDESGNNNNGTVFGATLTNSRIGTPNGAYSFNGNGNYIWIPGSLTLTSSQMTLCAMVQPKGYYSGNCQANNVLAKGQLYTTGHYALQFSDQPYTNNNCAVFDSTHEVFQGTFSNNTTTAANYLYTPYVQSNTWYCAITTFDLNTVKLYIDGVLKSSFTATNALVADTTSICIGCNAWPNWSNPFWLNGIVDDIRIYNRVLDTTEIKGYCSFLAGLDEGNSIASHVNIHTLGNGIFELSLDKSFSQVHVNVASVLGQSVYSMAMNNKVRETIDLSSFAKGIYLLNIVTEDGKYTTKLIRE